MEAVACKDWLLLSIMMTGDGDWLQRLDHHHCHFYDVPVDDGDVNDAHLDADDVDQGGG